MHKQKRFLRDNRCWGQRSKVCDVNNSLIQWYHRCNYRIYALDIITLSFEKPTRLMISDDCTMMRLFAGFLQVLLGSHWYTRWYNSVHARSFKHWCCPLYSRMQRCGHGGLKDEMLILLAVQPHPLKKKEGASNTKCWLLVIFFWSPRRRIPYLPIQ